MEVKVQARGEGMVMDVHLHAGCILMTYNADSPVKLVPLSDPLMGKLSTTKWGENFIAFSCIAS